MSRFGFALVSTCALAVRPVVSQDTLPVELNSSGMMMVRAAGPGQPAGLFVIDLGAGTEVLSGTYAERVRRGSAGYFTGFRSTGERVDGERARITPITLGPITTPADAVVWHGLDADSIAGLISARTFAHVPVTLDFLHHQLVFETPASLAARVRRGVTLPLRTDILRDMALDLFVDFDLGSGQVGTCEIDTGSQAIDVHSRYMPALGIGKDSGTGDQGFRARLTTNLAPVGAPQLQLERPTVRFGNYIYDCIIGTRFWSRLALTVDVPNRRVIVSDAPAKQ